MIQISEEEYHELKRMKKIIDTFKINLDINKDRFFLLCSEDPKNLLRFIDDGLISKEIFNKQDRHNNTCLHHISWKHPQYLEPLLNCPLMNQELFNKQTSYGSTCLHYICRHHPQHLETLLNCPLMNQELFNKQTKHGDTCLHIICKYHPQHLETLLNSPFTRNGKTSSLMNQELFNKQTSIRGDTCLHYICRHHPQHLETLLNSPFMNQELFNSQTGLGNTCLHLICFHNQEYLKLILTSPFMNQELLEKNSSTGKSFEIEIIKNKELINLPLFLVKLDDRILNKAFNDNYDSTTRNSIIIKPNELIEKRDKIRKAMKVIDNFMYKSYYKTGGCFYRKKLNEMTSK